MENIFSAHSATFENDLILLGNFHFFTKKFKAGPSVMIIKLCACHFANKYNKKNRTMILRLFTISSNLKKKKKKKKKTGLSEVTLKLVFSLLYYV